MKPVIVCFGTKEVLGDSLAPMVGSLLKERYMLRTFVYGDLSCDLDGKMIDDALAFLKQVHRNDLIIAIDASVGKAGDVGKIFIRRGVRPKAALDKKATTIGDVGLLGVVAEVGEDPLSKLMCAEYDLVENLAEKIALIIFEMIKYYEEEKSNLKLETIVNW